MASADVVNTKALVRDRIDEVTDESPAQSGEGEEGFASLFYDSCMKFFQDLYNESCRSSSLSQQEQFRLKEDLGRFFLWGDGFGNRMLDRILGRSPNLRNTVLGFIVGIAEVLTGNFLTMFCKLEQGGKISEQANDLNILIETAESIIAESGQIRDDDSDHDSDSDASDGSRSDILEDISSYTICLMDLIPSMERTLSHILSERQAEGVLPPISFQVSEPARTYVQNILNKFPRADIKLIERLGEANWRRHLRVRQRMEDVSRSAKAAQDEELTTQEASHSIFRRYSVVGESGQGTLAVPGESFGIENELIRPFYASRDPATNEALHTTTGLTFPGPFPCKICGKRSEIVTHSVAWKLHVLADIRPYICTFSACKDKLVTFSTRELWEDHEFSEHRLEKVWQRTECPLCLTFVAPKRGDLMTHVGKHMEQIALTALPPEIDFDPESEAESSGEDTYNVDGTEGIAHQSEVAFDPDTVNPVESAQRGGDGLGTKVLIHCDAQEQSMPGTELVKLQPQNQHDRYPTPPTSACERCRRHKTRCSGFKASKDGSCTACQLSQQECIFKRVPSHAQAFVAPHTAYPELQSTGSSKGADPFDMAVPEANISCSVSILQTRKPEEKWMLLPYTGIPHSTAIIFECVKLNSRFVNVKVLKVTLRCNTVEEEYFVTRKDDPELRRIIAIIKEMGKAQLRTSKDNKINICSCIEPVGAEEMPPDYVAEEHDGLEFLDS